MPARPNATRADIITMLREGHSNTRIMRELHCDRQRIRRIRTELDLPQYVPAEQTRTLEEKWASHTRPVDGGHLEWTGERAGATRTPVMRYRERSYSPAAVAFEMKHGRKPEGYVKAECGVQHCVAPDCVEDETGRQQLREQLRYLTGGAERKTHCVHNHDLAVHGRYSPDGRTAYCEACKAERKRAERAGVAS